MEPLLVVSFRRRRYQFFLAESAFVPDALMHSSHVHAHGAGIAVHLAALRTRELDTFVHLRSVTPHIHVTADDFPAQLAGQKLLRFFRLGMAFLLVYL